MIKKEDCIIVNENRTFERFLFDVLRLNYYFVPDEINTIEDCEKFKVEMSIDLRESSFGPCVEAFKGAFRDDGLSISDEDGITILEFNLFKVSSYNDIIDVNGQPSILKNVYLMYLDYLEQKANELAITPFSIGNIELD